MTRVCRHALAAIYGELLESADILVRLGEHAGHGFILVGFFRLGIEFHHRQVGQFYALFLGGAGKQILELKRAAYIVVKRRIVKIGVGDGGEEGIDHEMTCFTRRLAFFAQSAVDCRHAAHGVEQQIHSRGGRGLLAAYTHHFTSFASCRLLALIAEHCGGRHRH